MENYLPFEDDNKSGSEQIFVLSIVCSLSIDFDSFRPLLKETKKETDFTELNVYKNEQNDYLFSIHIGKNNSYTGRLFVSSCFRRAELQLNGSEQEQYTTFNYAVMLTYLLATIQKDTLLMHASVISNGGNGYLFMGKSGTGKTTHSSLWRQYVPDTQLINDDNPVVRIIDGQATVFGSPWSGKTPCYRNVSAPIGGFIRLRQAKENHISHQNSIESYASLFASSSGIPWDTQLAEGKNCTLQKLISQVSCWLLDCLPNKAAALLCAETVK